MKLTDDITVKQLLDLLTEKKVGKTVSACGIWASYAPMLAGVINNTLKRPVLYITAHDEAANNVADDIYTLTKNICRKLDIKQELSADAASQENIERLKLTVELRDKNCDEKLIISAPVAAISQPTPKPLSIQEQSLKIKAGDVISPSQIAEWLFDNGFENVEQIDMPSQYARRGGIIDIYAPLAIAENPLARTEAAIRIEFFGDEIESIRTINIDSQRSETSIAEITVVAPIGYNNSSEMLFLEMLPEDTIIILDEPVDIQQAAEAFAARSENPDKLYSWQIIYKAIKKFTSLELSRFSDNKDVINLGVKTAEQYQKKPGDKEDHLNEIAKAVRNEKNVFLYCQNQAQTQRVNDIIKEKYPDIIGKINLPVGFIHQGFVLEELNSIVISHHEIFGQYNICRTARPIQPTTPIDSFLDLNINDYVVHISYGIGRFKGIKQISKDGKISEYLTIEYAQQTLVHIPVYNISLVHKYIGSGAKRPKLSKVGTKLWQRQKDKVFKSVCDLAGQLLQIQARRKAIGGIAYPKDGLWQRQFDQSFIYQETSEQIKCIQEIKTDMQKPVAMDRLLCGDVGFGKTEVAMRAAFKAIDGKKQVAVLVPTTILCVQHGKSFTERFADFPVNIETLNRFKTGKEIKKTLSAAAEGKVDIVIGTHRILSEDVKFKNLGLVIIDEEQRFGVEHKERLKLMRADVDILTMTATPIPRTLHMSMLGLRDVSSIATAPLDRRSIVTSVRRYSPELIKKAIYRELNRDGQVYFLHNRVQSIKKAAFELSQIVPDAKIDIAHGQMTKSRLEKAMINFVNGKSNVLVCTTIIESGLDIPNANTIFISDTDRFGLAELHQLRGRVGRYKNRAYAYMLLPKARSINPVAAKRLKAIEQYSQLGAGFKIALRDLEIRGAGNILGPQQSGHINAVGYEMYCQLLSDAVKKMRNEKIDQRIAAAVDLGMPLYIPKNYIASERQRMSIYRKIADITGQEDENKLRSEMSDMFGKIPDSVNTMLEIAVIRAAAEKFGIKSISISNNDIVFCFDDHKTAGTLFAKAPGKIIIPDAKTVHLRLGENYFQPKTLTAVLRKLLIR